MFARLAFLITAIWTWSAAVPSAQASPCTEFCKAQHERCADYHCNPVSVGCSGGCSIFFTNNPNMCVDLCANDSLDSCQRRALDQAARCWQPCWQQKGASLQQWGNCMKPCTDQAREEMAACRAGGGGGGAIVGGRPGSPGSGGTSGGGPSGGPSGPGGDAGGTPTTPPEVAPTPGGSAAGPACPAVDLTGVWTGSDGGRYYIRQYGSTVWWYGESESVKPSWTNAAQGSLLGSELTLTWADVPKGRATGYGSLVLDVISANALQAKSQSGGFRTTRWTRAAAPPPGGEGGGQGGKKKKESLEDRLKGIFKD